MQVLQRILLIVAAISFVLLVIMFVLSFFVIFWPLFVLSIGALAAYIWIQKYFFSKRKPPSPKEKSARRPIVIEHRDDDVE